MRIKAIALRILRQLRGDRRTLALMFAAPILMVTLIFFILNADAKEVTAGIVNAPLSYTEALYENNIKPIRCTEEEAAELLEQGKIDAYVEIVSGTTHVCIDGTNSSEAERILLQLQAAARGTPQKIRQPSDFEVDYVYGSDSLTVFDNFGSALIGIIIFFFIFLVAGISFLQERTSGTLERLLCTPVRRWEVAAGYCLGFGVVTAAQAVIVTLYVIYVLRITMVGSVLLVLLTILMAAFTALTMGMLVSSAANTEFQIMQFIPLLILPQVFFSGLFSLSGLWQYLGYAMPLYYVADALTEVMIRGGTFKDIALDLAVLLLFCAVFLMLNIRLLKKQRSI